MLVLSDRTARQPTDPGYQAVDGFDKGYTSGSPAGFPMESPACPGVTTGQPHDGIALELTLTVPPFAVGYSFVSNFYTFEWPAYVCSQFNDFFLALQSPAPVGSVSGNVVFDPQGNPVSVNNAFLSVCGCESPPCQAGGKVYPCELGPSMLQGTGLGATPRGRNMVRRDG